MNDAKELSILLLEDQGLVRAGIRALIQISEPLAQVQEASTYEAAISFLSSNNFDIVFLDIDLKDGRSGIEVLQFVRERESDTKVIMLSGRSEKEIVLECIDKGASGFILKDMDSDGIFRRALDTVFNGGIFLPANIIGRGGFNPSTAPARSAAPSDALNLSARLLQVLYYLCQGLPNKAIAKQMKIEEGTIRKDYVPKLFREFKVARRTELIIEVSRRGLIIPRPDLLDA